MVVHEPICQPTNQNYDIFGVTDQFIDCTWALNATAHLIYYTQQTNIQWDI
jgi:hypothetical protein